MTLGGAPILDPAGAGWRIRLAPTSNLLAPPKSIYGEMSGEHPANRERGAGGDKQRDSRYPDFPHPRKPPEPSAAADQSRGYRVRVPPILRPFPPLLSPQRSWPVSPG